MKNLLNLSLGLIALTAVFSVACENQNTEVKEVQSESLLNQTLKEKPTIKEEPIFAVEDSNLRTVKKHFDSGNLKSEHFYNGDQLLYFDEYDSLGVLIRADRIVDFKFRKNGPVLDAFIKLYGKHHPGRDSILFQISTPSSKNTLSHQTDFYLIHGNRTGDYRYSWNVGADSIFYIKYDLAEFNTAGARIDTESAFIINYHEKTIQVDCRKRPIEWQYF